MGLYLAKYDALKYIFFLCLRLRRVWDPNTMESRTIIFAVFDFTCRRVPLKVRSYQGYRPYFSRREITALTSGSGNIAVCRHILVLPPPPKSSPPKNEKPPTAEILSQYFGFTASADVVTVPQKNNNAYRKKITAVWHYRRL